MEKEGFEYDHLFDWVMVNNQTMDNNIFSVESFENIKKREGKHKSQIKNETDKGEENKEEDEDEVDEDKQEEEEKVNSTLDNT